MMNTKNTTFNKEAKNEMFSEDIQKKCCKRSCLLGLLLFGQCFSENEIRFVSENEAIIKYALSLIKSVCGFDASEYAESLSEHTRILIDSPELCRRILSSLGYNVSGGISSYTIKKEIFGKCEKCRSEFLKGAFLSCGTVSSPDKSYHLEMTVPYFNLSRELLKFVKDTGLEAKYTKRTSHYVIYYKESDKIIDFLGLCGAMQCSFELCNAKIEKDIRNNCNRLNNCETANMTKQVAVSVRQTDAVRKIFACEKKDLLSDELLYTAQLRLEHPDASLSALALFHVPPITKSCVNRRLKTLENIASE